MTAIEIASGALRPVTRPDPSPSPGEVLVEVAAAGVNRPDILQRRGRHPPPPGVTDIPGLEVAGRIRVVGDTGPSGPPASATGRIWREGDEVSALLAGGGYAELAVAPGVQCLPIPAGLTLVEAAALPETCFTVWTNVFDRGRLCAGEWLLVHGGTSGIGTIAIQLAVARGAEVVATAGSAAKCALAERLGARRAINYRREDFVASIADLTDGRGVDVVLDIVGGPYTAQNLDCLARDGRLVQIGLLGGTEATIPLWPIMAKRLTITGSTLRSRTPEEKGAIARAVEREVWPLLSAGRVRPVIDRTLPLTDATEAHRLLEAGEVMGKIVLTTS